MHAVIIAISHKPPDWLVHLSKQYAKRMQPILQCQHIWVKPVKHANPSSDIAKQLQLEAEKLHHATPKQWHDALKVCLCVEGKLFNSEEFAAQLEQTQQQQGNIIFYIGGANGLCENFKQSADLRLSLSPFTMAHAVAQVVLIEQIYRGFSILQGLPYHLAH